MGAVSEYVRRTIAERSAAGQAVAIERGRWPVVLIPGYRRQEDGAIELDPETSRPVAQAFRMRAKGATVAKVREHLAKHDILRSYHGTVSLLASRQAIGEIRVGEHVGTVPALIDRGTFDRAQRQTPPRGPRARSERILARLGVLRCHCGSRMVVASSHNSEYWTYRCPPNGDCERRTSISAEMVEGLVVDEVKRLLAGISETASMADGVSDAAREPEDAQAAFDGAIRAFSGLETEPAAVERLRDLRDARDAARARHEELAANRDATTLAVSVGDWDELSRDAQRALITAVLEKVVVKPGRGAGRVTIIPRAE